MAILCGAVKPLVYAAVMDVASPAIGYVVSAICLVFVAAYALFDLKSQVNPYWVTMREVAEDTA